MENTTRESDFYTKVFTCGKTEVSRGDLESLPCPFCTENVDDETMQKLATLTECGYLSRLTREMIEDTHYTIWNKEKKSEIWWEEFEGVCNYLNIPYYEDLED